MTYKQRLTTQVFAATDSRLGSNSAQFPYGFAAYAKVAAKCVGKKLDKHAMYLGSK
jgi:hypothetical protein